MKKCRSIVKIVILKYIVCRALDSRVNNNSKEPNEYVPDTALRVLKEIFGKDNILEEKVIDLKNNISKEKYEPYFDYFI